MKINCLAIRQTLVKYANIKWHNYQYLNVKRLNYYQKGKLNRFLLSITCNKGNIK